jgi:hypothetical protein
MNNTNTGWRKRQIALDKKAENARELGMDYEPTVMDFAREAGLAGKPMFKDGLEAFAELVRADERDRATRENAYVLAEREACAKLCEEQDELRGILHFIVPPPSEQGDKHD